MSKQKRDDKIEMRIPAAKKQSYIDAANRLGEDLSAFLESAAETRLHNVSRDVPRLADGQTLIPGYRYLAFEGVKVKFRENGVKAIPAILGMYAQNEDPDHVAEALHLPLAAILEAKYFCETHPNEVDRAVEEGH